jgi:hypothetical protein
VSETGQRICRLAETAANAADYRVALRTLCELRCELEEFERQQAARALTAGESFGGLARALGVSRQAAHRRFRDLAPTAARDDIEPPTPETRLVVEYARQEASGVGAPGVDGEHLLLGILRNGDRQAAEALFELGVTLDDARTAARDRVVGAMTSDARAATTATATPIQAVIRRALLEARRHGAAAVGVDHLLLGALEDDRAGAACVLRALGVSPQAVRARVEGSPSGTSPDTSARGHRTRRGITVSSG